MQRENNRILFKTEKEETSVRVLDLLYIDIQRVYDIEFVLCNLWN